MPEIIEPIYVGTGTFKTTPRMRNYINQVLDSGRISYGMFSRGLEMSFAKMHDCKFGILSNSGTSALHVALQAMKEIEGWDDGDEVLVPATTFVATPNIVHHVGMKPVFVDIEYDTFGIDPFLIEHYLTERTRAIIPVHLFGQACKMTPIMEIAFYHDLKVIEDSCETMFVKRDGQMVGSMGDVGCFSMYMAHLLTAGVGGLSITNNPEYAAKMRSLVNHGLTIENLNPDENFSPMRMIGRRFEFNSHGHSFRITEFEAAIALAQLDEIKRNESNHIVKKRRKNAHHLQATLRQLNEYRDIGFHIPEEWERDEHAWMMFPILLPKGENKADFVKFLNDRHIETRDLVPLIHQPIYPEITEEEFPISSWLNESGFYVGCHQDLTEHQMKWLVKSIMAYYGETTY